MRPQIKSLRVIFQGKTTRAACITGAYEAYSSRSVHSHPERERWESWYYCPLQMTAIHHPLGRRGRWPRRPVTPPSVVRPDARDACTPATFGTSAARSERSPLARARPLRRRSPPRALIISKGKRRPRHADRPFSPRSRASWAAAELAGRAAAPAPLSAAKPRRRDAWPASR